MCIYEHIYNTYAYVCIHAYIKGIKCGYKTLFAVIRTNCDNK